VLRDSLKIINKTSDKYLKVMPKDNYIFGNLLALFKKLWLGEIAY
jgi:hypothetical protein